MSVLYVPRDKFFLALLSGFEARVSECVLLLLSNQFPLFLGDVCVVIRGVLSELF